MKNIIQASFLAACFSILSAIHGASVDKSIFEQIKNGICPDGLEYTCSVLAGGCSALPGALAHATLHKHFSDIPDGLSLGIPICSGIAATYTFYKIHQLLSSRTREAILKQKACLLEEIDTLKTDFELSKNSIIVQLNRMFTNEAAKGASASILINSYLEKLINKIKWINPKLIFLGESPINPEIIAVLEKTRTSIVTSSDYAIQRPMHQKYEKEVYNNQLSTKCKQGAWWTTKKTAQAGFFAAKVSAYVCWDLFKIILSNITRTIV